MWKALVQCWDTGLCHDPPGFRGESLPLHPFPKGREDIFFELPLPLPIPNHSAYLSWTVEQALNGAAEGGLQEGQYTGKGPIRPFFGSLKKLMLFSRCKAPRFTEFFLGIFECTYLCSGSIWSKCTTNGMFCLSVYCVLLGLFSLLYLNQFPLTYCKQVASNEKYLFFVLLPMFLPFVRINWKGLLEDETIQTVMLFIILFPCISIGLIPVPIWTKLKFPSDL